MATVVRKVSRLIGSPVVVLDVEGLTSVSPVRQGDGRRVEAGLSSAALLEYPVEISSELDYKLRVKAITGLRIGLGIPLLDSTQILNVPVGLVSSQVAGPIEACTRLIRKRVRQKFLCRKFRPV
jgi:hypothetical protein